MTETALDQRPVVLVHGFGGSAATTWQSNGWMDLIADAGRPVLGIDLLGHGTAPKPHDPEAYNEMARHVLDALPDTPVDAIGFSLGARTLIECARVAPERFARLVLTGVGANLFEEREDHARIAAAVRGEGDPTDPFIRYFADIANDPDSDIEALRALIDRPSSPLAIADLAPLTMPVLVLLGDGDFAGPADPLLEAIPHASFTELRRCDHFATPQSMQCLDEALNFVDASPF
ncbi:MAG: alpha/beta fold hydrolase [Actinomycetota bacterium]